MYKIPNHLAIIMDGNGRWAKEKGFPRSIGHKNGVKSVQLISELCSKLRIEYLTLYTLSLENLNRPKLELISLMSLLSSTIKSEGRKYKGLDKSTRSAYIDTLRAEYSSNVDKVHGAPGPSKPSIPRPSRPSTPPSRPGAPVKAPSPPAIVNKKVQNGTPTVSKPLKKA